jgi:hypothetical protein
MAYLKTETLFEDLKTDIEQLAGYAAQHGNYGAAEDALDCLGVLRQRVELMTRELKATRGLFETWPKGIW